MKRVEVDRVHKTLTSIANEIHDNKILAKFLWHSGTPRAAFGPGNKNSCDYYIELALDEAPYYEAHCDSTSVLPQSRAGQSG